MIEKAKAYDGLVQKREEQEHILRDQLTTITRLEASVGQLTADLAKQEESVRNSASKSQSLEEQVKSLEQRLSVANEEREEYKSKLYGAAREDTQWAMKLSREDLDATNSALQKIAEKLAEIETENIHA